jgi:protein-S-isoprenylcysteine O-methyltransferase Ste14
VLAQSVLMPAVILLAVFFPGDWGSYAALALGGILVLIGGAVGIAGVMVLGRNRTPFPRPRAGSQFIQHGIYARVRHPLYSSVVLLSLGWALLWQSWPALLTACVLMPFFRAKAKREERWLREQFPGYADYARRVPGFLPRTQLRRTPE